MLAPEPYLSACLDVIALAVLEARSTAMLSRAPESLDAIAELMDEIHNLPTLIRQWERCDEAGLRASLGPRLRAMYEQALANH